MRRHSLLFAFPLFMALALMGCESTTDIQDIDATGQWDGVGPLQQAYPGLLLNLTQEPNGVVTGNWRFRGTASAFNVSGTNSAGHLELTLSSFPTGTAAQFQGQFTNDFRMEGTLNGAALTGAAVFRRTSF
jgi:hypothetical protein